MGTMDGRVFDSYLEAAISRRRLVALGGAALASGLLAACGSDDDDDEPAATATEAESSGSDDTEQSEATATSEEEEAGSGDAEPTEEGQGEGTSEPAAGGDTPQYGGTLMLEMSSDAPHLDMHQSTTSRTFHPMSPCYSLLAQFNQHDVTEIIPDLAESWEFSDDGLVATFALREGVQFHSGKALTSEDAKASFERIIFPPDGVTSPRRAVFSMVESVDAPDDLTVVFNLEYPSASLLTNIAVGWNVIYNAEVIASGNPEREVDGTGPFVFKEYVEGVHSLVERNPNYFVPDRPYLDAIKIFVIPDPNTALSSVITEQIHVYNSDYRSDGDEALRLAEDKIDVVQQFSTSSYVLDMNSEREPWGDPRVRKACSLAIDRYAALDVLNEGTGQLCGVMVPNGLWGMSVEELQSIPGYSEDKEADREEARALLAEAGFPENFEATILTRQGQEYEDVALFVQDQLSTIGINMVLDVAETATYAERLASRDFDLFGGSFSIAVDDPDATFGEAYICEAGRNYSQICHEEFNELYDEQSQELDDDARKEIVERMERISLEEVIKVNMGYRTKYIIQNKRIRDYMRPYSQYLTEKHEDTWLTPE